jgi:anti-sigma regulatory factor (Ser/Thr protein kinase)
LSQDHLPDVVCITLPQLENSAKLIRLTTAGVASRAGLDLDQADDLNTGLDELFRLFLAESKAAPPSFSVRYTIHPVRLEVVANGISQNLFDDSSKINRYSRFILENVADKVEELPSPDGGFEVIIVKNLTS